MNFSYWEKSTFIKKPDVVIIGSGIVGLFAAYFLKRKSPKLHVLVLERGMLPYGASTRNAGFACFGSPSELLDDLKNTSESEVFSLVEKRWKGLRKLRETLGDKAIGYEPLGGYELFTSADNVLFENCSSQLEYLNKQLFTISGEKEIYTASDKKIETFGFKNVEHLILNKEEGQLHTGKLMHALIDCCRSAEVEILNGALVEKLEERSNGVDIHLSDPFDSITEKKAEVIYAGKVLICTNGFAGKFLPAEDIQPARAQVMITSPIDTLRIKGSFHYQSGYYYFRNIDNRILLGGGRNLDFENEFTEEFGLTTKIQNMLEHILHTMILPGINCSTEMSWSGIMGLGKTKSPIVKKTGENVFCAIRMGGMGIAMGSQVGEDAASMILETL